MCQACMEMELYYAYLDAVEEAKRKAQPWECEVTVFPQADAPASEQAPTRPAAKAGTAAKSAVAKSAGAKSVAAKSGFACDEPE